MAPNFDSIQVGDRVEIGMENPHGSRDYLSVHVATVTQHDKLFFVVSPFGGEIRGKTFWKKSGYTALDGSFQYRVLNILGNILIESRRRAPHTPSVELIKKEDKTNA